MLLIDIIFWYVGVTSPSDAPWGDYLRLVPGGFKPCGYLPHIGFIVGFWNPYLGLYLCSSFGSCRGKSGNCLILGPLKSNPVSSSFPICTPKFCAFIWIRLRQGTRTWITWLAFSSLHPIRRTIKAWFGLYECLELGELDLQAKHRTSYLLSARSLSFAQISR